MKEYKIYEHLDGKTEAVKQGWSWPGFFLLFFWAFYKRLWWIGLLLLSISVSLVFLRQPSVHLVGGIILRVLIGFLGNQLREKDLIERGFEYKKTVTGPVDSQANALYLKESETDTLKTNISTEEDSTGV